jgi:hypothetical protein
MTAARREATGCWDQGSGYGESRGTQVSPQQAGLVRHAILVLARAFLPLEQMEVTML